MRDINIYIIPALIVLSVVLLIKVIMSSAEIITLRSQVIAEQQRSRTLRSLYMAGCDEQLRGILSSVEMYQPGPIRID